MTLQKHDKIVRTNDFISTEIDDEVVLMHIDHGRYYGLNDISGHIWKELENATEVAALISKLQLHYQGDPEQIRTETLRLLEKLLASKLIEVKA